MSKEWLFIDTHVSGRYRLGWLSLAHGAQVRSYSGRPASLLRRLLGLERARALAVLGVCVVSGPGPFSAIRLGVLYANMLARLLRRPLVGVEVGSCADLAKLAKELVEGRCASVSYIAPIYDAAPNITIPRSV